MACDFAMQSTLEMIEIDDCRVCGIWMSSLKMDGSGCMRD